MDKSKQKEPIIWNTNVLNALAEKYSFSKRYIKMCINDERTPTFADRIKAEYKKMCKDVTNILNNPEI